MLNHTTWSVIEAYHIEHDRSAHRTRKLSTTEFAISSPSDIVFISLWVFHFQRSPTWFEPESSKDYAQERVVTEAVRDNAGSGTSGLVVYPCTFI